MNLELHVAQSRSYNIYSVITELWAHRINLFIRLMSLTLEFVDYDTYGYVLKFSMVTVCLINVNQVGLNSAGIIAYY